MGSLFVTIFLFRLHLTSAQICDEIGTFYMHNNFYVYFDPFIVYFDPWVIDEDYNNTNGEDNIISFVETISTRFIRIMMDTVDPNLLGKETIQISFPSMVAKYNKQNSFRLEPSEMVLGFELDPPELKPPNAVNSFDVAKTVADDANKIYPGTVNGLCLLYRGLDLSDTKMTKKQLEYATNQIALSNYSYKLGAKFPVADCGQISTKIREYFESAIEYMDFVYFYEYTNQLDYKNGPDIAFERLRERFTNCKVNINGFSNRVQIGFETLWSDTDRDGKQNISNLVRFWSLWNKWALETNTTVILYQAFDSPYQKNTAYNNQGWWRLIPNQIYASTANYLLEEKCSIVPPAQNTSRFLNGLEENRQHLSVWQVVGIILGVVVFLVVSLSLIFAVLYRRLSRRAEALLTAQETKEFFEGFFTFTQASNDILSTTSGLPYCKDKEISADKFKLDEAMLLGAGAYGSVCLAKVVKDGKETSAAVKKAMPSTESLKSLMSEIKVLTYLGTHENIVGLVGAYTAELTKGTLYVFLELCSLGSLEKYLRNYKRQLSNGMEKTGYLNLEQAESLDEPIYENIPHFSDITTFFRKWCIDIIKGMEYLASKNVLHGDLATRNVLLCKNMRAKLCDFGLSRRLYEYTSYMKSNVEPLPWRWMAPESLCCWEFNEKTDVWAFGVTCWEICTYGGVPYPGLTWTVDFASKLEAGLKLQQPANCPPGFYEVMLKCWEIEPKFRPTFTQLLSEI